MGGKLWSDLGYADDLAALTQSVEQIKIMLSRLMECAGEVGLKLNLSKIKIMLIGPLANSNIQSIEVENEVIEVVSTFEYLGRKLNNKADDSDKIKSRISRAWQAFNVHKNTITSKSLSMKTKRQIVETYILPAALYATETVSWTIPLMKKMKVLQNHLMRWMSGTKLSDQVTINRLCEITKLTDIERTITMKKLTWFGFHIKRSDMPVKTICEGRIPGIRRRGRPSWRWLDDILKWTNVSISELNHRVWNRSAWRQFCYDVH